MKVWSEHNLDDLGEFKNGVNFSADKMGSGIALVNVKDITDSPLLHPERLNLVDVDLSGKNGQAYFAKEGDIFFVRSSVKREGVGAVGMLKNNSIPVIHCGFVIRYRIVDKQTDQRFLFYLLNSPIYREKVRGLSGGATIVNVSQESLKKLKLSKPILPTQKRIASILSAYDDLIENNLKRIKLLEEIAQRTYEEWFMKFRINGEQLPIDEATGLPIGWTGSPLGDLISFQKGKKASIIVDEYQNGYEKLLLLDGIESGKYLYTNPIGQVIAERNDLIMLMDGARSSKVFFADRGVVGSTLSKIVIKNSYLSSSLLKHFFEINFGWMQTNNTGAAIPHANKKFINSMPFSVPTLDVFINWKTSIEPIYNKIQNLKDQILLLKQSRDILLPRLMSGTINVEN